MNDDISDEATGLAGRITLYYELAPTGDVHAGLLRTLLWLDTLRGKLSARGRNVQAVLRINDRTAISPANANLRSPEKWYRHCDDVGFRDTGLSFLDFFNQRIASVLSAMSLKHVRVLRVSDLMRRTAFRRRLWRVIRQESVVRSVLRVPQSREIVFPYSGDPRRKFTSRFIWIGDLPFCYDVVERTFTAVDEDLNGGFVQFRLESALTWAYFDRCIDFHGDDHAAAFRSSRRLLLTVRPQADVREALVNTIIADDAGVLRKSKANFTPVLDLIELFSAESVRTALLSFKRRSQISEKAILARLKAG